MKGRRRFHPRVLASIVERQNGKCACCGEPLGTDPRGFEFHHELPLHLGGEDSPENLVALIKKHHLALTIKDTKNRAKMKRIIDRDGLGKRRLNQHDRALERYLEEAE